MVNLLSWGAVCTSVALAAGATAQNADAEYDYVIVGGGLTGLVAAARLSEDADGEMIPKDSLRNILTGKQYRFWFWITAGLTGVTRRKYHTTPP